MERSKKILMIKALVNGNWEYYQANALQPGGHLFNFENGIYETFRTLEHKPVFLKPHLDRLFDSAKKIDLKIYFTRKEIEKMIKEVIDQFNDPDQRARILLVPNKVIIYTTSLDLDQNIYNGVSTKTVTVLRKDPHIKTTDHKDCLNAYYDAQKNNCFDAILINDASIVLEGSRSNVFWVKDNTLFTRRSDVLPGVTRQTIISNSPFPVLFEEINLFDLMRSDELFLTNSGSGIIPVIKVNSSQINNGNPGPITRELLKLYDIWLKNEI